MAAAQRITNRLPSPPGLPVEAGPRSSAPAISDTMRSTSPLGSPARVTCLPMTRWFAPLRHRLGRSRNAFLIARRCARRADAGRHQNRLRARNLAHLRHFERRTTGPSTPELARVPHSQCDKFRYRHRDEAPRSSRRSASSTLVKTAHCQQLQRRAAASLDGRPHHALTCVHRQQADARGRHLRDGPFHRLADVVEL